MDSVADGDVILIRCAAVGHDMKVEPRYIPLLAVFKVVGIYLCFGRECDKHGSTKQNHSEAKPHRYLIFGKNSDFAMISTPFSAKKTLSRHYINKVCRETDFFGDEKCLVLTSKS